MTTTKKHITRRTRLEWTNWTFGVYYLHLGRKHMWGIDIGPYATFWQMPAKKYKKVRFR